MPRTYDITKKLQDLRYLDFGEHDTPTGLRGAALKAREGTGAHAVYYKLSAFDARAERFGTESVHELVACRLAELLGIEHAEYQLVHALVTLTGTQRETWLVRSKSFRGPGERKMPFGLFYRLRRMRGETPFDLACRMGWRSACEQMLAFDFLIGNAGRDASNVEVVCGANGRLRLAPLYAHGHSLLATCAIAGQRGRSLEPLRDVRAENCFGGTSLEENLQLIDGKQEPLMTLAPAARDNLLRGLSAAAPAADLEAIWAIIWTRWERYARLRGL